MKIIQHLKICFLLLIYNVCDVAQNLKGGIFKNAKKYIVEVLFYIFMLLSIFILFGYIFGKGKEIYNLSNRIGSTEKQLEQYRKREERSIKELGDSNRKLQEITIRIEQLGKDTEAIRFENIELRNQLQKYSSIVRDSEKQTIEIIARRNNQSKSIDTCRTIIQGIQKRGYIKN